MIPVNLSTQKIEIVLGGAVTTNQLEWVAVYERILPGNDNKNRDLVVVQGVTNSTTDVEIVPGPSEPYVSHILRYLHVHNADTVAANVTIKIDTSGTERVLHYANALAANGSLQYVEAQGFI